MCLVDLSGPVSVTGQFGISHYAVLRQMFIEGPSHFPSGLLWAVSTAATSEVTSPGGSGHSLLDGHPFSSFASGSL